MPKHVHIHLPRNIKDRMGVMRTLAKAGKLQAMVDENTHHGAGGRFTGKEKAQAKSEGEFNKRKREVEKARGQDMESGEMEELKRLMAKFLGEEANEAEHKDSKPCGCQH